MKRIFTILIGWLVLCLFLASCAPQPTPTATLPLTAVPLTATASPTPQPTGTATRSPTAEPATATPTLISTPPSLFPTADSSVPLNSSGPWFAYRAWHEGFENEYGKAVVVNPDGSGRRSLASNVWSIVGSPASPYLAVLTQPPELQGVIIGASVLEIVHLPDMHVKTIALLSSPSIATFDYSQLNYRYPLDRQGAVATITWAASYKEPAWSPNGRYLAFTAAIDGPTADLYVYDTLTDQIHRLTDGPEMATQPEWSPDGKWIVHRGLWGFGAGCTESGVWAAAVDGSQVKWLGPGECIIITRWTGPETFEAYTPPPGPATATLAGPVQRVDIAAGTSTFLYMTPDNQDVPTVDCFTQKLIETPGVNNNSTRINAPNGKWFVLVDTGLRVFAADGDLVTEVRALDGFAGWQADTNAFVFMTPGKAPDRRSVNYFQPADRTTKTFEDVLPAAKEYPDLAFFSIQSSSFFLLAASIQELDMLDLPKGQFLKVDGPLGDFWNITDADFAWVGAPKVESNSLMVSCYAGKP